MVELDESALARVLSFSNELQGRSCCRWWAEYLFKSMQLEHRLRFHKLVRQKGHFSYHHSAVRSYGEDFEECVAYQFEFYANGDYSLQWNCSFGQWSAANERQVGRWTVTDDKLRLESMPGPEIGETEVRFAPAGRISELPVDVACSGNRQSDGESAPAWEYEVRGKPKPADEAKENANRPWSSTEAVQQHVQRDPRGVLTQDDDARFVEIDGEFYEVSGDIRNQYPEADWKRLMGFRIRFGLQG
eukprot:gnl/TRDRNA2_/TRDRNA2_193855_c0_seq1.p1 gnl/TRDRNA2_/TRDRNA2_193855_c0~~gnl/TRDRNA2_/TRDRNA2_193855_c0_seq1.p1  ORF type:complete len:245 (+),score=51.03 gnl/TRDRNA2_/TRDRNA2_193855_c0_seq1:51-785(+)